jgi:hypothetical protein
MLVINRKAFKHFKGENMEKAKILRNLEKLVNRDFGFINAGRILLVANSKSITEDLLNSICFKLGIEANRIHKTDLIKIIDSIKGLENIE